MFYSPTTGIRILPLVKTETLTTGQDFDQWSRLWPVVKTETLTSGQDFDHWSRLWLWPVVKTDQWSRLRLWPVVKTETLTSGQDFDQWSRLWLWPVVKTDQWSRLWPVVETETLTSGQDFDFDQWSRLTSGRDFDQWSILRHEWELSVISECVLCCMLLNWQKSEGADWSDYEQRSWPAGGHTEWRTCDIGNDDSRQQGRHCHRQGRRNHQTSPGMTLVCNCKQRTHCSNVNRALLTRYLK